MGIVFGVTGTKGPAYNVIFTTSNFEIRSYEGFVTAEVNSVGNNGFTILANYIGVFGEPKNEVRQALDMTHPVLMVANKIEMTSPTINEKETMKFVLPSRFKRIEDAPKPTDPAVIIKITPKQVVAVQGFSGWYSHKAGIYHLKSLSKSLREAGFLPKPATETTGDLADAEIESLPWSVAQYHPPFTLPFLRLNEVWIQLDSSKSDRLQKLLETINDKQQCDKEISQ